MQTVFVSRTLIARLIGFTLVLFLGTAVSAKPHARPVVAGYVAAFHGIERSAQKADLSAYSHLNLAFANPDSAGRFVADGRLTCMADERGAMPAVDALRRTVSGLRGGGDGSGERKVMISVGGGIIPSCSGDWRALLAPDRRAQTAAELVALVDQAGFDGIDVDIEGELLTAIDRSGDYTPFIETLSAAMRARGKLLSSATASYDGGMIPRSSIPYFDLIGLMSYDAIGPSWGTPGSEHSPYAMAAEHISLWLSRGAAPEQLLLGLPFYGYGFGGEKQNWSYAEIVAAHGAADAGTDRIGEACGDCRYISFNGPATIERKAKLAAERIAGVMVWEVSQDSADHALTAAIRRAFLQKDHQKD